MGSSSRAFGWLACAVAASGCVLGYDYDGYERVEASSTGGTASSGGGGTPSGGGSPSTGGAPTGGGAPSTGGATGGGGSTGGGSASGGTGGCDTSACGPAGACFSWTCDSGPCTKKNHANGTPCAQMCIGGMETASTCQAGQCVAVVKDCAPYGCDSGTEKCRTSCSSSNDCAPSHQCGGGTCQDCVSCGDWLAGEQGTFCGGGTGCAQWTNLKQDCCTSSTCQTECSGSGDFCSTGNTVCFSSSPPSGNCQACLQTKSPCLSYLMLCSQDSGH